MTFIFNGDTVWQAGIQTLLELVPGAHALAQCYLRGGDLQIIRVFAGMTTKDDKSGCGYYFETVDNIVDVLGKEAANITPVRYVRRAFIFGPDGDERIRLSCSLPPKYYPQDTEVPPNIEARRIISCISAVLFCQSNPLLS